MDPRTNLENSNTETTNNTPVQPAETSSSQPAPEWTPDVQPQNSRAKKKHTGLIVALVIVIVLLAAAVGGLFYQVNQANKAADEYRTAATNSINEAVSTMNSRDTEAIKALANKKAALKDVIAGKIVSGDYRGAEELVSDYNKIYDEVVDYAAALSYYDDLTTALKTATDKMTDELKDLNLASTDNAAISSAFGTIATNLDTYADTVGDLTVPSALQSDKDAYVQYLHDAATYYEQQATNIKNNDNAALTKLANDFQTKSEAAAKAYENIQNYKDNLDKQRDQINTDLQDFKTKLNN